MRPGPKQNRRTQAALGALRQKNGWGKCWVCGSTSGVKTSREGYGPRCKQCIEKGDTNDDVAEYENLKAQLTKA